MGWPAWPAYRIVAAMLIETIQGVLLPARSASLRQKDAPVSQKAGTWWWMEQAPAITSLRVEQAERGPDLLGPGG